MQCTQCGEANRDAARFCAACGSALSTACASCGNELAPGARFCDGCGAATGAQAGVETSGTGELRKTVTILFADLVGSTSLQEKLDPESVRRVMTRFYDMARAVIEHHEGSVVKFVGDGVMAAFGTPVVREDDALRAVRAAHALVAGLAELNEELERDRGVRLQLRAGVNTGEVVVGGEDGDLIGDPVNLAARLEQAAGEGTVLVGEQTERLVRRDVTLEPVAPLELKGKRGSVRAFRLLAVVAAPDTAGAPETALVGRAPEMERLQAAFEDAVTARACRLVTVIGSPGIGKTRLADELARAVEGRAVVLTGRCEPTDGGITFAPVVEILRAAAGIGEGDAAEQARAKLTGLLPESEDREVVVERALGVLGAVSAASTEETFWGVRRVLEALARAQPLVLILDDVHWGQPTYLDLVEHLVEWTRDAPLLLVALARPELRDLRESLASGRRVSDVIELDPLGAADSRTLVDELLGQVELPERLAERVLRATEGNPLFVGETVRMLVDEGVLRREGETWVAADDVDVEMPPTIHALIAARLERLGGDERAVVERASVIGKQFYRGAVADLCTYPVGRAIDGHLETLRRKELVQPEGTYWIDEPVFRFHHVLIRDAAYRSVLKEARAELHERFADWLESKAGEVIGEHEEVVAFHLEQAHEYRGQLGPLDDRGRALGTRAAERLASAGRRALAREDLPAAANLLGRALERLDEAAPQRAELLVDLAEALISAGDTHAATPVVEELQVTAGAHPRLSALASVYAAQLAHLTDSSRLHEAVDAAEAAVEQLSALGDDAGAAKASHVQAGALAQLGQVGATEAALDRALAAARTAGDTRRVSAVLAGAPLAALWGPSAVVRASGRCLDVVRILRMTPGNRHLEAAALGCQAVLEAMRGRADAARAMLDTSRATFEELGLALELLENEVHAGIVELLDDDPAAAETRLRTAYDGFSVLGAGAGTERAEALLARALLAQGRDDDADALTRIGEERGGEDLKAAIAWCGVRAEVLARRGDHAAAEQLARRGATLAKATDALTDHADARMALAAVLRAGGQEDAAVGEARSALELYGEKENAAGARRAAAFAGVEPDAHRGRVDLAPAAELARPALAESSHSEADGQTENVRLARRYVDAYNAREWDIVEACIADDYEIVDHRTLSIAGRDRDRTTWYAQARALTNESSDHRYDYEVLADFGDLLVTRSNFHGHLNDGGGAFVLPLVLINRRRGDQFDRAEAFEPDDDPAWEARLAELLGPRGRALTISAKRLELLRAREWDAFVKGFTSDVVQIDRRTVGGGEIHGAEQIVDFYRGLIDLAPDLRPHLVRVLDVAPNVLLVRLDMRGHAADGGAIEVPYLLLAHVRGELTDRLEVFDVDAEDAARARFAELAVAGETANTRLARRWVDAINARDWDAAELLLADDCKAVDHRLLATLGRERDRATFLAQTRALTDQASDARFDYEVVADFGDLLVGRGGWRGHLNDGGGEFALLLLLITRRRGDRFDLWELFEPDDDPAWEARLAELLGPRGRALAISARRLELLRARDWDGFIEAFTPDAVQIDRRKVGGGEIQGADQILDFYRGLIDLAPDLRPHLVRVLDIAPDAYLLRLDVRGHAATGGAIEVPYLLLTRLRGDLADRMELFDLEAEGAARARFAELTLAARPVTPRELMGLFVSAYNTRDSGALSDLFAPDLRVLDRRPIGWGTLEDRDTFVQMLQVAIDLAPDAHIDAVQLALGRRAALARGLLRGHLAAGGGAFELELVILSVIDAGQVTYFELFDGGQTDEAFQRFEEIGAATAPERALARINRLANARDWEALGACFARDHEVVDHRVLGWEPQHRPEGVVGLFRSWADVAPDSEFRFESLAGDDGHMVSRYGVYGHAGEDEGGGQTELVFTGVATFDDGVELRVELFGADDEAAALARFDELHGADRSGTRRLPGAASTATTELRAIAPHAISRDLHDRYVVAYNARDWDGVRDLFAPDLQILDRRLVGWGGLEGPDALIARLRGGIDLARDYHTEGVPLALGLRAAVTRYLARGHLVAGGGEVETEYVLLSLNDGRRITSIEIFAEDAAGAALERFEQIGAQSELERFSARVCRLRNARDWDGVRDCYADDHELIDRRALAWEPLSGADAMVEMYRSWDGITPDVELWCETLAADDAWAAMRFGARGHAADGGGALEYVVTGVTAVRDGRFASTELFGDDDDAAALARYEELRRADAQAPGRPTTREVLDRYAVAANARDWDALRAVWAEDVRFIDRRLVGWGELEGIDALVEILTGTIALAPDSVLDIEPLISGHRAAVSRQLARGHLQAGGGPYEIELVNLMLIDDGRIMHSEIFEGEDAQAALARFEEIGAATETERLHARVCRLLSARDWDGLTACYSEDYELVDHRQLGWEPLHGGADMVAMFRSWTEVAPDLETRFETIAGDDQHVVIRWGGYGHASDGEGGGAMEYVVITLVTLRDGRIVGDEVFGLEDEVAALARFEALRQLRKTSDAPATMREHLDRYVAAVNARDWDALRSLNAPDLRFVDRRLIGWGELEGVDALVEIMSGTIALGPDMHMSHEPLALGHSASLMRQTARGHLAEGGGEFEVELLVLTLTEEGRTAFAELFDEDDAGAALLRFEEIGAATEPERVTARICRLFNARDWQALSDCYADEHEAIDHRVLGWEPLRGREAMVDLYRSWIGIAPDVELRFEVLAGDEHHFAVRFEAHGHAATDAGGGLMELVVISVLTFCDGRQIAVENFDAGEEPAALARLAELING